MRPRHRWTSSRSERSRVVSPPAAAGPRPGSRWRSPGRGKMQHFAPELEVVAGARATIEPRSGRRDHLDLEVVELEAVVWHLLARAGLFRIVRDATAISDRIELVCAIFRIGNGCSVVTRQFISTGSEWSGSRLQPRGRRRKRGVRLRHRGVRPCHRPVPGNRGRAGREGDRHHRVALKEAGAEVVDIVRVRVFIPDRADVPAVSEVVARRLGPARAANTTICSPLPSPRRRSRSR